MRPALLVTLLTLAACAGSPGPAASTPPAEPAPPGTKVYHPENPAPKPAGQKVSLHHTELYNTDAELQASVDVDDLAAFVETVHRLGEETLATSPKALELGVEFVCTPEETQFRFLGKQEMPPEELLAVYQDKLQDQRLPVRAGRVHFMVVLAIQP